LLLKCNYCDPTITKIMREQGLKSTKSINPEFDEYVKDEKNKYYHVECYVQHLIKRKKIGEEEAREKLKIQLELVKVELKQMEDKDKFYKWIMNFYDSSLPAYYCTKITEIVNGQYEKVNEAISYEVLFDIYDKMANYLRKNAFKKNFQNIGQRMNYDLAIIIGKYGDYKKYIEKQKLEQETTNATNSTLQDQTKVNHVLKKKEVTENEDFNLSDVLDELLL
jgi:hypothetical protein